MSLLWQYRWLLLAGLRITVEVTVLSAILAVILAFIAGLAVRLRSRLIRWPVRAYIEFFRGSSTLAQLFWLFFVLPDLGIRLTPMTCGVLGLGLCHGAYGAEIVRGALDAFPRQQRDAAIALNFSQTRTFTTIILPQTVVVMLPLFGNLIIEMLKTSALVSLITLSDLTFQAKSIIQLSMHTTNVLLLLLVAYFVLARIISFAANRLEFGVAHAWRDGVRP